MSIEKEKISTTIDSKKLDSFLFRECDLDELSNDDVVENANEFQSIEVKDLTYIFENKIKVAQSNKELYMSLCEYSNRRLKQLQGDYFNGDKDSIFNEIDSIKSDSVYVNRLLDDIKLREAHYLLSEFDFVIDYDNNDPILLEEYGYEIGSDCQPKGFNWKITDHGLNNLKKHPERNYLYDFAKNKLKKYPNLTNSDDYYVSPYFELSHKGGRFNESGIARETLSLFEVDFDDMNESVKDRLFDFGLNLNFAQYERIERAVDSLSYQDRVEMVNAMISTEFGDDFGDMILTITENAEADKSIEVFKIINEYRNASKDFSSQFDEIDADFSFGAEKAMNERLTDLLAVAAKVAKDGKITVDTDPRRDNFDYVHDGRFDIEIDSFGQIIETMRLFLSSQKTMSKILKSKETCIIERYENDRNKLGSQTYMLINDEFGIAQFHVRRFGAGGFDKVIEHGNYNGTEATMSWSINPKNPFDYPDFKDSDCINIRFDREGRSLDEAPNSPDRSPIRDDGIISLDIGSVLGEKTSASTILGRTIAAGNILRAGSDDSEKKSVALNHNTNYLDQEYGGANSFAWLATVLEYKYVNGYEHIKNKKLKQIGAAVLKKSILYNKAS